MWCREIPSEDAISDQTVDMNLDPQSDVRCCGKPNRDTQWSRRASTQSEAVVDFMGMTSGHLVYLSMTVRRKACP